VAPHYPLFLFVPRFAPFYLREIKALVSETTAEIGVEDPRLDDLTALKFRADETRLLTVKLRETHTKGLRRQHLFVCLNQRKVSRPRELDSQAALLAIIPCPEGGISLWTLCSGASSPFTQPKMARIFALLNNLPAR
jgi:hypothetical protein